MFSQLQDRSDEAEERLARFFEATPRRRWVRNLFRGYLEHSDIRAASAMAFHLFLATMPTLAFAGWLAGMLVDRSPEELERITLILDLTPGEVQHEFRQQLGRLSGNSAMAPLAIAGTLWLTSDAFHTVMTVFEQALQGRRRSWWTKRLIGLGCALTVMTLVPLLGWLAVYLAGGPADVLHFVLRGAAEDREVVRWLAMAIVAVGATGLLALFFRVAVSRPHVKQRRVWPGALLTVAIGTIASVGFAAYAREIASYAVFYGGLAAVAVLLIWLWICSNALLLGGELNAQLEGLERQEPQDSARARRRVREQERLTAAPPAPADEAPLSAAEPRPAQPASTSSATHTP